MEVSVGEGTQTLRWLANAGLCRYDSNCGIHLGFAKGLRLEDGTILNMSNTIKERLKENDSVYVILSRDEDGEHVQLSSAAKSPSKDASEKADEKSSP